MITDAIRVVIPSEAWVSEKNNYMYIGKQYKSWFPDDCFIARGTGRENKERLAAHGIEVHYQHASEIVRCFMELRDDGPFRPSNRGAIKAFYAATKAKVGDTIVIEKSTAAKRTFGISLCKSK